MARGGGFSLPVAAICVVVLLAVGLTLLILLPLPDQRGYTELSKLRVNSLYWSAVPLRTVVADVNAEILKKGETRYRLFLPEKFDPNDERKVSFQLDADTPVTECAYYIAELSSMRLYSTPKGVVIDSLHQDHRSWRRKFRDWVMYDLLSRWNGRQLSGS
jgi:hypothetical protein